MMSRSRAVELLPRLMFGFLWLLWLGVILRIVLPWNDLRDHTHWGKVAWIPFISPPVKLSDIVGNVLLYVPLGYLGSRLMARSAAPVIMGLALALSLGTETLQLYSHRRFPSATDVTCNLSGCMAGIYFARPRLRRVRLRLTQEISS